jgi:hypothetical protein
VSIRAEQEAALRKEVESLRQQVAATSLEAKVAKERALDAERKAQALQVELQVCGCVTQVYCFQ